MAPADLVSRFTDQDYATKKGVATTLGVSLIDSLWRQILNYRLQNSRRLLLKTIPQVPFSLTATPTLAQRYSAFEQKLASFAAEYRSVCESPSWKEAADKDCKLSVLKAICEAEGKKIPELTLKAMLTGMYRQNEPDHAPVLAYRDLLTDLGANPGQPYDEDFLGKGYAALLGTEELTVFYRTSDAKNTYNSQVVRTYERAPAEDIDKLMSSLADFISRDPCRPFVKALAAVYFFDYIEPFDFHNRMMGVLVGKAILAHGGLGEAAAMLPLEAFFEEGPRYDALALETQKEADLTYLVLHAIKRISARVDELLNRFVAIKKETYRSEFVGNAERSDEPVEVEVPRSEEKPVEVEAPAKIEVVEEEPLRKGPTFEKVDSLPIGPQGLAIVPPRKTLSDKEIKEAARYIRETNPTIRPAQAKFFASHCAVGSYYTINDFKKSARCAYETARTSMDNLAAEGFYKKLKIKNKFVYTPIAQNKKEN